MTNTIQETLLTKLRQRTAQVAILGLGYVGLPLATVFAEAGFTVTGVDPDQRKVDTIHRGESHIKDVPSELVRRRMRSVSASRRPCARRAIPIFLLLLTPRMTWPVTFTRAW